MNARARLVDDANAMSSVFASSAIGRALDLFHPARRPARKQLRDGYLDLLGDEDPTDSRTPASACGPVLPIGHTLHAGHSRFASRRGSGPERAR